MQNVSHHHHQHDHHHLSFSDITVMGAKHQVSVSLSLSVVCLPACLSVCLPACLFVCLSACLPVCLYVCLPVCLSVSLVGPNQYPGLADFLRGSLLLFFRPRRVCVYVSAAVVMSLRGAQVCLVQGCYQTQQD